MPEEKKYLRKVIRIRASDSPNVRRALDQIAAGQRPTGQRADGTDILPGVLSWEMYVTRRKSWSAERQCVGLDADFWRGAQLFLYPTEWLNLAERRHELLRGAKRKAKAIGCDPAEGGDNTAMAAVDELGLIELVARKTPNTDDVARELVAFMRKHKVDPDRVCMDRGGGGKQHADRLRANGLRVRTVGFGEAVTEDPRHGVRTVSDRLDDKEGRAAFKNRRAQLYGELAELFDPGITDDGPRFALPPTEPLLRQEMVAVPKTYTKDGVLFVVPKHPDPGRPKETQTSLVQLIGWSPDRLDALALAVHALLHDAPRPTVSASAWG